MNKIAPLLLGFIIGDIIFLLLFGLGPVILTILTQLIFISGYYLGAYNAKKIQEKKDRDNYVGYR